MQQAYTSKLLTILALTQMIQTHKLYGQNEEVFNKESRLEQHINLVNINTASLKDLEYLPGIGKTLAIRIIERRKIKAFQRIQDLKYIDGIGEKKFSQIKAMVRVQ